MLTNNNLLKTAGYIDGEWIGEESSNRFEVINPYSQEVICTLPEMGIDETNRAINAANSSWPDWRNKTAKERAVIIRKWFELIMQNQEDLAILMTTEQGKPLAEARGEVVYGASFVEWFAEEGKRTYGDIIPTPSNDRRIVALKQPIGVVAAITPWNFPLAMITRKCAPALAAGCPVVIKPASETPLCALALAELADQAGIPKGVLNVVVGTSAKDIGITLTDSNIVRKLSFTGSTAVGKILTKNCADTMKKVSMELGGNAPFIVFDDADLDASIDGVMASKYRNAGQTCVCANRILVQSRVYDKFIEKLTEAVKSLKVGNGLEEGVNQGPLISQDAVKKVQQHIDDAVNHGGEIVCGGNLYKAGGTLFEPTIIANATTTMKVATEETFGPLAPIFKFNTEEEALAMANDTEFGLASYFYTNDMGRIWRFSEALEYGIVGVNEGIISTELAPFGGVKESGLGREGSHFGIDEFLEIKYICMGGLN